MNTIKQFILLVCLLGTVAFANAQELDTGKYKVAVNFGLLYQYSFDNFELHLRFPAFRIKLDKGLNYSLGIDPSICVWSISKNFPERSLGLNLHRKVYKAPNRYINFYAGLSIDETNFTSTDSWEVERDLYVSSKYQISEAIEVYNTRFSIKRLDFQPRLGLEYTYRVNKKMLRLFLEFSRRPAQSYSEEFFILNGSTERRGYSSLQTRSSSMLIRFGFTVGTFLRGEKGLKYPENGT